MSTQPGQADDGAADAPGDPARPATYREVFSNREFRGVYSAGALSSIGDFLGKVALAAVIYQATGSVFYSAASLAITYLPWLAGAPFLVALAERFPYRRVMLASDIGRFVVVGVAAIPGLPLPLVPVLMFLAAVMSPPFDASRSALLPSILSGDRYVLGLSVKSITDQATQVAGYVCGGALSAINPRMALGIDAATFGVSALLIFGLVGARPAVPKLDAARGLLRETADGFSVVFGRPVLRSIAIVVLSGSAFAILPEGLAAAWSHHLRGGSLGQGLIMAAMPTGIVIGGIVIGRMVPPAVRQRLIRPLAMLVPLSLVAALTDPPLPVVLGLTVVTGFALSVALPANALFVRALPNAYRARAFGVMQGGLQIVQGAAMLLGGVIASQLGVPHTVGVWALFGVAVMAVVAALWPKPAEFDRAIENARRANEAAAAAADGQRPPAAGAPADGRVTACEPTGVSEQA